MSEEFRAFWAVIPSTVLDDMQLPANAKILYGVLSTLMRREGWCRPSNAQLAEAMHCSEDVVMRWIKALSDGGHIRAVTLPNKQDGGKVRYKSPTLAEPVFGSEPACEPDEYPGTYLDKCPPTYLDKNPGVP